MSSTTLCERRAAFDVPADVAYFNTANLSPLLHRVRWTEAVLGALDERIRVVSVTHVHWTDGALLDLEAIADRAHAFGCALVIDASQSAGALPLDAGRLCPDFLVSVGYKWLLGPFGLSFLHVARSHRDGEPLEENWIARAGSEDFSTLTAYRDE